MRSLTKLTAFNQTCYRTSVISLCKMLELLKAIESTFERHSLRISEVCVHATQHLAYIAIANMEKAKVGQITKGWSNSCQSTPVMYPCRYSRVIFGI